MTKSRKPTFTERMARAIRSFLPQKKPTHIRLRKRKKGAEYQIVRGREVVARCPAHTHTLDDVKAAYPNATLSPSLGKRDAG